MLNIKEKLQQYLPGYLWQWGNVQSFPNVQSSHDGKAVNEVDQLDLSYQQAGGDTHSNHLKR